MIPNNDSPNQGELMSDVRKSLLDLCDDFLFVNSDFEVVRLFFNEIVERNDQSLDYDTAVWIVITHLDRLKDSLDEYHQTVDELRETVNKLK